MRLSAGVRTDKGCVRVNNEDTYAVRPQEGLFVVCDGMGGCQAGEVASGLAVTAIVDEVANGRWMTARDVGATGYLPQTGRLVDAVRRSNELIYRRSKTDSRQADMGTTVVSAWIAGQIASVAHVGDSRAYLWHDDQLHRLTRDHSFLEACSEAGVADQLESLEPDTQNALVRVLGREPEVDVDIAEVPMQAGDYLLLCSDGLTRMVSDEAVGQTIGRVRDAQKICDVLVDTAIRNGGLDNITVVAVEMKGNWWQRIGTPWKGRSRWQA
jgi:protein phosphatase